MRFEPEWPQMNEATRLLCQANAQIEAGARLDSAVPIYERALSLQRDPLILRNLGRVHLESGRYDEAERCFREAESDFWLAFLYEWIGEYEKAWEAIRNAAPSRARAQLLGRIANFLNLFEEGIEVLRPYTTPDTLLERARLHDRAGQYAEAWEAATAGNRAKGQRCADPFPDRTYDLPAERNPGVRPILIVGMPRSGTTLMERLLGRHPEVECLGESEYWNTVDALLGMGRNPTDIGPGYVHRHPGRRTLDKNPTNFRHLDLIRAVFPDAVLLRMVRDRDDIAMSCYLRHFDGHMPWAYDWDDIQNAIDRADELMDAHETYPVAYEELVTDTERVVRGVVAHCGLAWDDRCLDHRGGPVRHDASYEEVRRPVTTGSVGHADHYRRFFAPSGAAAGI